MAAIGNVGVPICNSSLYTISMASESDLARSADGQGDHVDRVTNRFILNRIIPKDV